MELTVTSPVFGSQLGEVLLDQRETTQATSLLMPRTLFFLHLSPSHLTADYRVAPQSGHNGWFLPGVDIDQAGWTGILAAIVS